MGIRHPKKPAHNQCAESGIQLYLKPETGTIRNPSAKFRLYQDTLKPKARERCTGRDSGKTKRESSPIRLDPLQ